MRRQFGWLGMATISKASVILALALVSQAAMGCVLGEVYNLPIPFETYAAGAASALVASFAIVAFMQHTPVTASDVVMAAGAGDRSATWRVPESLVNAASTLSVVALLLTIVTGFLGSTNHNAASVRVSPKSRVAAYISGAKPALSGASRGTRALTSRGMTSGRLVMVAQCSKFTPVLSVNSESAPARSSTLTTLS